MMNQFAQLISAERQTLVLLDTCTIINAYAGKPDAVALRSRIAKRKDIRIIVPRLWIREVAKVAGINQEQALALIESFSEMGQIDYIEENERLAREAKALSAKYPEYCHYPDNHYLVHCRNEGAVLVTYDSNLHRVADLEGVMVSTPRTFRK
jgi:predicted nucleic acid-binding protein